MDGMLHPMYDSLVNLVSSLGSGKDKASHGVFATRPMLQQGELDALYHQNWLGGKLVDVPSEDATREWRSWTLAKRDTQAVEAEERRLGLHQKVLKCLRWAAKDGGAALLIGNGKRGDLPLDPDAIGQGGISFLHVLHRWELSWEEIILDPSSPFFGQPTMWRMFLPDGDTVRIHPSRIIVFRGIERADSMANRDPFGFSVYERLKDAIRDAVSSFQTSASMLQEAKVDVIKIPGLSANVAREDYRSAVVSRFGLAMALKAVNNAIILDAEEQWEQKTLTFQGLPEIMEKLLAVVAGAGDMPVSRLFGRSATGLNATGKSDLESYYQSVRARQVTEVQPVLAPLDRMLVRSALGRVPRGGAIYEWRPLWSVPATDQATVNHNHAMAIEAYARSGVFSPKALQTMAINQLEEDGFLPGAAEAAKADEGAPGLVGRDTPPPVNPDARPPAPRAQTGAARD